MSRRRIHAGVETPIDFGLLETAVLDRFPDEVPGFLINDPAFLERVFEELRRRGELALESRLRLAEEVRVRLPTGPSSPWGLEIDGEVVARFELDEGSVEGSSIRRLEVVR